MPAFGLPAPTLTLIAALGLAACVPGGPAGWRPDKSSGVRGEEVFAVLFSGGLPADDDLPQRILARAGTRCDAMLTGGDAAALPNAFALTARAPVTLDPPKTTRPTTAARLRAKSRATYGVRLNLVAGPDSLPFAAHRCLWLERRLPPAADAEPRPSLEILVLLEPLGPDAFRLRPLHFAVSHTVAQTQAAQPVVFALALDGRAAVERAGDPGLEGFGQTTLALPPAVFPSALPGGDGLLAPELPPGLASGPLAWPPDAASLVTLSLAVAEIGTALEPPETRRAEQLALGAAAGPLLDAALESLAEGAAP